MKEEREPSTSSREIVKTGRDLDAEVAERVMGWARQPDYNYWMTFLAGSFQLRALIATWKPSESVDTAMQVEDRIAELGKQGDYIAALWDVMGADRGVNFWTASNIEAFWLCVHATAEQRCRAALSAVDSQ